MGERNWLTLFGMNLFDFFDWFTANCCLPIGAFFTCLFIGWYVDHKIISDEMSNWGTIKAPHLRVFTFMVRFVCPVLIFIIFLHQFGVI